eukprot:3806728-Rhodomonas_salina.1
MPRSHRPCSAIGERGRAQFHGSEIEGDLNSCIPIERRPPCFRLPVEGDLTRRVQVEVIQGLGRGEVG